MLKDEAKVKNQVAKRKEFEDKELDRKKRKEEKKEEKQNKERRRG